MPPLTSLSHKKPPHRLPTPPAQKMIIVAKPTDFRSRFSALARKLDDFGFGVLRATHEMTDDRMMVVFELERDTLPLTFKHQGPPVWVNSTSFLSKWRGGPYGDPFIEDGRWVVISERQYTDARSMVEREAPMAGIGKELDLGTMAVMDHESSLANIDPLLLTELLDPKMPWEI